MQDSTVTDFDAEVNKKVRRMALYISVIGGLFTILIFIAGGIYDVYIRPKMDNINLINLIDKNTARIDSIEKINQERYGAINSKIDIILRTLRRQ